MTTLDVVTLIDSLIDREDIREALSDNSKTGGHKYKLKLPLRRTNIYKYFFWNRAVLPWYPLMVVIQSQNKEKH